MAKERCQILHFWNLLKYLVLHFIFKGFLKFEYDLILEKVINIFWTCWKGLSANSVTKNVIEIHILFPLGFWPQNYTVSKKHCFEYVMWKSCSLDVLLEICFKLILWNAKLWNWWAFIRNIPQFYKTYNEGKKLITWQEIKSKILKITEHIIYFYMFPKY